MKRVLCLVSVLGWLVVLAGAFAPAATADTVEQNDPGAPGSVLVFPRFVKGKFGGNPKSSFTVDIVCPDGVTCNPSPDEERVHLRAAWVCAGSGSTNVCRSNSFNLHTNPEGFAVGRQVRFTPGSRVQPPCGRGFLVVWAIDEFGHPIKFDGLVGTATLRESASAADTYAAVPIQAVSSLAHKAVIDGGQHPDLRLDGVTAYRAVTGTVSGPVEYNTPTVGSTVTLLTLDAVLGRANAVTTASLEFFDDQASSVLLVDASFTCWGTFQLRTLFSSTQPPTPFPAGTGTVDGTASGTLLGIVHAKIRGGGHRVTAVEVSPLDSVGSPVSTTLDLQ
jgi:hypothetical protein